MLSRGCAVRRCRGIMRHPAPADANHAGHRRRPHPPSLLGALCGAWLAVARPASASPSAPGLALWASVPAFTVGAHLLAASALLATRACRLLARRGRHPAVAGARGGGRAGARGEAVVRSDTMSPGTCSRSAGAGRRPARIAAHALGARAPGRLPPRRACGPMSPSLVAGLVTCGVVMPSEPSAMSWNQARNAEQRKEAVGADAGRPCSAALKARDARPSAHARLGKRHHHTKPEDREALIDEARHEINFLPGFGRPPQGGERRSGHRVRATCQRSALPSWGRGTQSLRELPLAPDRLSARTSPGSLR